MALIVPAPGHLRAILINNNALKTKEPDVDLILSAANATEIMIANDDAFTGASWEAYVTSKEWILADDQIGPGYGDGNKAVYVKFRNLSEESVVHSATIYLKTSPPIVGAMPILINEGRVETNNRLVTLLLNASGASFVELYNENNLTTYTGGTVLPYNPTVQWTLSENNGSKTVYIVFIDEIGNKTAFFSDSIVLAGQSLGVPVIQHPTDGSITTDHFIDVTGASDPDSIVRIQVNGG